MSTMNPAEKAEALHAGTRIAAELASPWFRTFLALDPAVWFRSAATPVLALNGSKDLQVPGVENLEAIRVALPDPEKAASRFILLDGLNHLFQHAGTGLPEEYGDIAETFAPEALSLVGDWILDQGN